MNPDELRERRHRLFNEAEQIRATALAEKRDVTGEEGKQIDSLMSSFDEAGVNLDRIAKLNDQGEQLRRPAGRRTEPAQPAQLKADAEGNAEVERPTGPRQNLWPQPGGANVLRDGGFRSLGEMAWHVRRACVEGGVTDRRLEALAAATTFGNEGAGADGGFAVPPEFREAIMVKIMGEDSLLSRCDQVTCGGNYFVCPVDETTPWQTSGGILATWDGEAQAANQSKPQLQDRTIKLNKLRALVPMSEEMLEDSAAIDSYLRKKAPDKIAFKINLALLQGTGAGMPLGVLNSVARVTVPKESGQQANTVVAANIQKMFNRMYGPSRSSAVWVYNQEIEPQLFKLSQPGTDNTGNAVTSWGTFMFVPPGAMSAGPYASLMGRPMIPTQACPALSSEGDIMFIDFSQYLALLKSGINPKVDTSMHLWFDQDLTAYKFTLRMGGMPWWSQVASPLAGSNTYSPYVTLQAR